MSLFLPRHLTKLALVPLIVVLTILGALLSDSWALLSDCCPTSAARAAAGRPQDRQEEAHPSPTGRSRQFLVSEGCSLLTLLVETRNNAIAVMTPDGATLSWYFQGGGTPPALLDQVRWVHQESSEGLTTDTITVSNPASGTWTLISISDDDLDIVRFIVDEDPHLRTSPTLDANDSNSTAKPMPMDPPLGLNAQGRSLHVITQGGRVAQRLEVHFLGARPAVLSIDAKSFATKGITPALGIGAERLAVAPASVKLQPGERRLVTLELTVDEKVPVGDYQAVVDARISGYNQTVPITIYIKVRSRLQFLAEGLIIVSLFLGGVILFRRV